MRASLSWLLFSTAFLSACGTDEDARGVAPKPDAAFPDAPLPDAASPDAPLPDAAFPDAPLPDAGTPDSDASTPPSLQERIDVAVSRIEADTCFSQQSDASLCEWGNYEVGPAQFDMAVSTGEAVLLIDSLADGVFPQFVRYRNRIAGFYRINGDQLEAQTLSVRLPKQLGDAMISFAGPEFIPAAALTPVGLAANRAYAKVPLLYLGHGGITFGHLVELSPEQPLVLLDLERLLKLPSELCARTDAETVAAVTAHFAVVADSLQLLMRRHNVRFVNASFGDTTQTLARDWSITCGTSAPDSAVLRQLIHIYDPFYSVLFHTEGVITAQAATQLGDAADFPFDQVVPAYANRVRVGFFSSLASGLDELGRGNVQKVEQFPPDGDADVFLNWDCEGSPEGARCVDPHYELAGPFGLLVFTVPLMSPSYVTPLAVGRLLNLRYGKHGAAAMDDALVQTLRQELTPSVCGEDGARPCAYQDPILHRQLEIYRQHYR